MIETKTGPHIPIEGVDFARSIALLKKINSLVVNGKSLKDRTIYGDNNVWMFFQSKIFYYDLRNIGSWDSYVSKAKTPPPIKAFIIKLFALFVSLFSIAWMFLKRTKILIYAIDLSNSSISKSDSRMDPIYSGVFSENVSYGEIFHSRLDRVFLKNLLKRKRPAIYLKSFEILIHFFSFFVKEKKEYIDWNNVDLSTFSERDIPVVKEIIEKYLNAIPVYEKRIRIWSLIMKLLPLKAVFSIDNTRDYYELILAAHLNNIPFFVFQHGHFTKYHVGWLKVSDFGGKLVRPDKIYVWSEFWKDELIKLGTYWMDDEIVVGGLKELLSESTIKKEKHKSITVVIPFETDNSRQLVKEYIERMISGGIRVFFKLRKDVNEQRQLEMYSLSKKGANPLFIVSTDNSKALSDGDVFAGTHSTYLYDVIARNKPVVLLDSYSDFGEGLARNGLADRIHINDDVCVKIEEAYNTPENILEERKKRLFGNSNLLMKDSVRQILSEINV